MKFSKSKNKKTKTYIKFDVDDRKTYLLGFRKRKLERKEKAKLEIEEAKRKEKREVRKKRMEMVNEMMNAQETDSESDDDNHDYASYSSLTKTDSVSEVCGESTVQVSGLSLDSKMHIGANSNEHLNGGDSRKKTSSSNFKLKLPNSGVTNKILKSAIWKTATKDALKNFKQEKNKKKQLKKRKVMITEL